MGPRETEALVLRGRPCGEADRIYSLLSPDLGRFEAIARGVRRSRHARGGKLEVFSLVWLHLAGASALPTVAQVDARHVFRVTEDLDVLASATYLLELYDRLAPAGANPSSRRSFHALRRSLEELESSVPAAQRVLRTRAELRLLGVLGTAPFLSGCTVCRKETTGFCAEVGGLACVACAGESLARIELNALGVRVLRLLAHPQVEAVRELARAVDPSTLQAVEAAVQAHLGWHWPLEIRSRAFVHQVQALSVQPLVDESAGIAVPQGERR